MIPLSNTGKKHIVGQEIVTYYLYELYYDDGEQPFRITNNHEPVTWGGNVYEPFEISHGDISQGDDGKINDVTISVGNAEGIIQYYVEHYEIIGKNIRIIQLIGDGEAIEGTLVIKGCKATKSQVDFTAGLGLEVMKRTIPSRRMYSRFCSFKFRDAMTCKYSGTDTKCDRSFDDCKRKGNIVNFGGFPGIINDRIYL